MENKTLYLVVSHSGTFISNVVRLVTRDKYSHVSISLNDSLTEMYSFGRKTAYNPFVGRYVKQSRFSGMFKRFSKTNVAVIKVDVPEQIYNDIKNDLEQMYVNREQYKYNYRGLFLAAFGYKKQRKNRFYCSEFMHYLFVKHSFPSYYDTKKVVKPVHFLKTPGGELIYEGKLTEYPTINNEDISK